MYGILNAEGELKRLIIVIFKNKIPLAIIFALELTSHSKGGNMDSRIIKGIRENALDSTYRVINNDKLCKLLSDKLSENIFGDMQEVRALETEAILSEYIARLMELAYLKGVQDMFEFNIDITGNTLSDTYCRIMGEGVSQDSISKISH